MQGLVVDTPGVPLQMSQPCVGDATGLCWTCHEVTLQIPEGCVADTIGLRCRCHSVTSEMLPATLENSITLN